MESSFRTVQSWPTAPAPSLSPSRVSGTEFVVLAAASGPIAFFFFFPVFFPVSLLFFPRRVYPVSDGEQRLDHRVRRRRRQLKSTPPFVRSAFSLFVSSPGIDDHTENSTRTMPGHHKRSRL